MSGTSYTSLARQVGLMREMQVVANNIANLSTTGYRKEGVIFSEYVHRLGEGSISIAHATGRLTDRTQGPLTQTKATFDIAIEGRGFFQIETSEGLALTRAGSFTPNPAGELVTPDGFPLLDLGGAPIFVPADGGAVRIAPDGTLSVGDQPIGQIGIVEPTNPQEVQRRNGTRFLVQGEVSPSPDARILQGFLEGSNVNPVEEIARMIEVQRAYELGAQFLERESERRQALIDTLGR